MSRLVMWYDEAGLVGRQIGGAIEIVETAHGFAADYITDRRIPLVTAERGPDLAGRRKIAETALCRHLIRRGQVSALRNDEIAAGRS